MDLNRLEKRERHYNMIRGEMWLMAAEWLKAAADNICADYLAALYDSIDRVEGDVPLLKTNLDASTERNQTLFPVYMLLAGYAIENLLKGIIICRTWSDNPEVLREDNFANIRVPSKKGTQDVVLKNHTLRELLNAKAMTLDFGPDEEAVMDELTPYITWGGRYTNSPLDPISLISRRQES